MMTSMGTRGDAGRLEALGFAAYLTKPVKQSQLFDCLMVVLHRRDRAQPAVAPRIVTRHALAERRKRTVRILLAEDNAVNRRVALKTLERLGYRADAVVNGAEALEALARRRYDVVLMDVQMPVMDGIEATRIIRALEREASPPQHLPIIALTAHAVKDYIDACLKAGMDDYLIKPVWRQNLIDRVDFWISQGASPDSAAQPASLVSSVAASGACHAAGDAPLDFERALAEFEGNREFLTGLLERFLENVRNQLGTIREALDRADAEILRREAHAIKGGAANLAAVELSSAAAELEITAKSGSLGEAAGGLEKLEKAYRRLDAFVHKP